MYRIDADTHISSEKTGKRITAEELIRQLDAVQVDKALVWLHPNQTEDEFCDEDAQNAYLAKSASRYAERLLPMGWVNPRKFPLDTVRGQIRRQLEEYGFYGIKLNGAQNFYDLANEAMILPVVEEIAKVGCVLAFHSDAGEYTRPEKIAQIAARFPETRILLVHMGQTACDAAIEAARTQCNITLIGSGMKDYTYVEKARKELGAHRVCYGSDAPFGRMNAVLDAYHAALNGKAAKAEEDLIYGGNLARVFGLEEKYT